MAVGLNTIEEEVVFLKAIGELIDSMVNFEIFDVVGKDPESSIRFHTITHQRFFNTILVDFLSTTDSRVPVKQKGYLAALGSIVTNPNLDVDDSAEPLRAATREFIAWLQQEVTVTVWLPSIDADTSLNLTRESFLKMCGNISKHNFLRLGGVAESLISLLGDSGISIEIDDALLALADFYDRFHTDIFNYHGSTIAEFLNDIRWGIYEYLQPELSRSLVRDDPNSLEYRYTYPTGVVHDFAKVCYWELMNDMRSTPYVPKFRVTEYLKLRY